ncbi:MFS transporter [Sphingomonas immobilis]|uniref:MFS transporter n=1 Tax=Sphingomonas immobilis TaxID=3063997 RepID=A0ABT8ZX62_9SPHN|nr:MFS transporter [Sphingomonas sp. CA1-15]MDO7842155.1 MFS transporter [Sphingomonas sp. CA1-15]
MTGQPVDPDRPLLPKAGASRDQLLLFGVMMAIAIGNTGLQSVLPGIGRSLKLPDPMIALAFSLSAVLWSVAAPAWAKRIDRLGAKQMVLIGLGGFVCSLLCCGLALAAGIVGMVSAGIAFAGFVAGRGLYGLFGAAAPPAAQALVVANTPRAQRTNALSLLASAFGLGTIVGPALAPFFILPWIGLAGPAFVFALVGVGMFATVALLLPAGRAGVHLSGVAVADPAIGAEPSDPSLAEIDATGDGRVGLMDPRVLPWMIFGLVSGHAQAIAGQTMAFLIIDRTHLSPALAQPLIGLVLMGGAVAALLAQWGVIPRLNLAPRALVLWGTGLAAAGCAGVAAAGDLHAIGVAFAIASLGFGLLRPGFTAGASLAVGAEEQAAVAGQVTANNGFAFVFGPSAGILLYGLWSPLPYLVCAGALVVTLAFGLRALRPGSPALAR